MMYLSSGTALSILGAYALTNLLPFDSFLIAAEPRQIGNLGLHYLALASPFFFCGAAVGMLLDRFSEAAGEVYAVNLLGSALGCLLSFPAPNLFGGVGTVFFSSLIAAFAGTAPIFFPSEQSPGRGARLLTGAALLLSVYPFGSHLFSKTPVPAAFELEISPYKSLSHILQVPDAEIVSQNWNAISRVDVVESPTIRSLPGLSIRYKDSPPAQKGLFENGDNLSPILEKGADLGFTDYLPVSIAYQLRPGARALVIEPRGGLDILTALQQGASGVTAVEQNPLIIQEAPHIYHAPRVETFPVTGRTFLRQTSTTFDLIHVSLSSSYHPVRSGAYSLQEQYLHTRESYQDALQHLDEDGLLVIPRWLQVPPSEWLRAFILAVHTLEAQNLDPARRIVALRSFNQGLLLVKKSPFTEEELTSIRAFSRQLAFDLVHLPDLKQEETNQFNILGEPLYYQAFSGYLSAPSRPGWLAAYPYDVSPPTDNHPFFGHYFKWSQAPRIWAELGKTWQPFGGAGYFVLLILLILTVVIAGGIILLPLLFSPRRSPSSSMRKALFYFGFLGLGFLLVEIPLIQRTILYLGSPSQALTVVLFSILLFSGLGSLSASRVRLRFAFVLLVPLILGFPWLISGIFNLTLGLPLLLRLTISLLVFAPLGFLMGIPLPGGLHLLKDTAPRLIPWAWGVNGALSVISSVLAALIALSWGYQWALSAGALCYAGAWVVLHRLLDQKPNHPLRG
jgi:hypothetical protein